MSNLTDKIITLYRGLTLTLTASIASALREIDVENYDKMTIYIKYNASTVGNTLKTQLKFNNQPNDDNQAVLQSDADLFHPEPHEAVDADGIATIVGKVRHYVALTTSEEAVPPISMPVNDKKIQLFISEIIPGGAHGVVTVTVRLSKLGE